MKYFEGWATLRGTSIFLYSREYAFHLFRRNDDDLSEEFEECFEEDGYIWPNKRKKK